MPLGSPKLFECDFGGPVLDFVKIKLCLLAILVLLSWFVFCPVGKLIFGLTNIAFSEELGSSIMTPWN